MFDQGYFCYETDGSEASAIIKSYCIPGKKSCGTITIPATVTHQNKTYTVMRIRAMITFLEMTELVLPNTVAEIGKQLFFSNLSMKLQRILKLELGRI